MVAEEVIANIPQDLLSKISILTTTLQALGGIILLYIIFGVINLLLKRKRNKKLESISKDLKEIKKILKNKKKKKASSKG